MKTFTSHLKTVYYNYLVCEFTAHYTCRNAEMNLKSTTTNVRLTLLDCCTL